MSALSLCLTKEEKTSAMSRYQKEVDSREFRIQTLKYTYRTKIKDDLEYAISLINNIENLISDAPTMIKIRLIGSIFPEKLEYDGKSYRTTRMNKLLEMIYQQTNELRKPKKEKTERKLVSFSSVPGNELFSNQFFADLSTLVSLRDDIPDPNQTPLLPRDKGAK